MELDNIDLEDIIRKNVKEKFIDLNLEAFYVGKNLVSQDELCMSL